MTQRLTDLVYTDQALSTCTTEWAQGNGKAVVHDLASAAIHACAAMLDPAADRASTLQHPVGRGGAGNLERARQG